MATNESVFRITRPAAGDLSASQYRFVTADTNGRVAIVGSAGATAIGVLVNKPDAIDRAAAVAFGGVQKVVAGGTIAAGANVQSDASGDALLAASGDHVLGVALEAAVDGAIFEVLLVSKHILA